MATDHTRRAQAARLKTEREQRGWGVRRMARFLRDAVDDHQKPELPSFVTYVKRWESGTVEITDARYRAAYARVLDMPESDLFDRAPASTPTNVHLDEERLAYAAMHPRRRDSGAIDALAAVLAAQRQAEDNYGSASLIEPVQVQMLMVTDLVIEARGDYRDKVLTIGAQWAQFIGWLYASVGDLEKANGFYHLALGWATEADEPNMVATALNMQGHTAWLGGKPGPVVGLSGAAQRDGRISPGVRALAI